MSTPIKILIIEDSEADTELLIYALRQGGYDPEWERVETPLAMETALMRKEWDIVLADYDLPHMDANTALMLVKKCGKDIPFIIVTGHVDENMAAAAMKMGAHDYVMKNNLTRLIPAIDRELREAEVRRQHRRTEQIIQHQTYYDLLTDLPNRVMFQDRLTLAIAHANRSHKMLAVLFVDLDRFKTIIDTLGHAIGDLVLRGVAERLRSCLEQGDTLARMGGDEFVVLLPQINRADRAARVAQRILEVLVAPFEFNSHELHITTSIGIALYPYDGDNADTLLKNADTALYRAKEQGRNNYQLYTPAMNARAFERLALENSLRKAVERKEFLLHYQPQVDMKTRRIIGMEGLVRWQHPDLGLVYPAEFVPIAEETGLIVPLGEWVLYAACVQTQAWLKGGETLRVSVNLSTRQFQHHDLMGSISRILKETKLPPHCLELEITESIAMQNADFTMVILRDLKAMGVRIAMDDFGTGYSSLSYLRKFPIDTLKIDQSFVRDISNDANDAAIANTIIVLAHSLKLDVIAEGVESQAQYDFLLQHGCNLVQGFYFSNPVPPDEFERLLVAQKSRVPSLQQE